MIVYLCLALCVTTLPRSGLLCAGMSPWTISGRYIIFRTIRDPKSPGIEACIGGILFSTTGNSFDVWVAIDWLWGSIARHLFDSQLFEVVPLLPGDLGGSGGTSSSHTLHICRLGIYSLGFWLFVRLHRTVHLSRLNWFLVLPKTLILSIDFLSIIIAHIFSRKKNKFLCLGLMWFEKVWWKT